MHMVFAVFNVDQLFFQAFQETKLLKVADISTALLTIYVDCALNLPVSVRKCVDDNEHENLKKVPCTTQNLQTRLHPFNFFMLNSFLFLCEINIFSVSDGQGTQETRSIRYPDGGQTPTEEQSEETHDRSCVGAGIFDSRSQS